MKSTFESWLKFILFGCLVGVGISACSDDALEGGENPDVQGDNTPAYLTVSFSTAGNSSRSTADDANNTGDKDGDQEDSGHHNDGTQSENTVSDALVVIVPETGNTALAKLYTIDSKGENEETETPDVGVFDELTTGAKTKIYNTKTPIKLSVGEYRVLVVANPPTTLKTLALGSDGEAGITNVTKVKELYDAIISGAFDASNMTKFTGGTNEGDNDLAGEDRFMMANKKASDLVELKKGNDETNPAFANIEIERAVAKITFRPTTKKDVTLNNGEFEEGTDDLDANVYPVKVVFGNVKALTVETTINGSDVTLNCARWKKSDTETIDIYVLKSNDEGTKYYTKSGDDYSELTGESAPGEAAEIEWLYDDEQAQKAVWYVKLEKYALVNLMKKTNYVRHTISAGGLESPFGELNGSNFLWTPYWDEINKVDLTNTNLTTDNWFWNTLAQVSEDSKKPYNDANTPRYEYYTDIPTTNDNQDGDSVEGTDSNNPQHQEPLEPIGHTLDYVFENATDIEHQTHGLSTGISFMARIYQKNDAGELVNINGLYRYDGHLFENIQDMVNAYGTNAPQSMMDCLNNETVENLEAAGIEKFASNVCYYYTTEIKHFDNNNPRVMGNMEFAVMRNNIYSLAVENIHVIGDPYVDITPNIPDETDESYLSVRAKIMPWIVRYHDIEFE